MNMHKFADLVIRRNVSFVAFLIIIFRAFDRVTRRFVFYDMECQVRKRDQNLGGITIFQNEYGCYALSDVARKIEKHAKAQQEDGRV